MIDIYNRRDISHFVLVRLARVEDERAIGELLVRAFVQTYSRKLPEVETNSVRKLELHDVAGRREEGLVYVMELGYRIIGTFTLIRPGALLTQSWLPNTANLRCVAIDPEYHGLGLSQQLLVEAERRAREWGSDAICLHVQKGAEGVAKMYEKFGFRRDNRGDRVYNGSSIEGYAMWIASSTSFSDGEEAMLVRESM